MHNLFLEYTWSSVHHFMWTSATMDHWCLLKPDLACITCSLLLDCAVRMKKWGERLTKVEQLAQSFRSNPLTARYKPRLWPCQPSSVWNLYPRQSMAITFAQRCKEVTSGFVSDVHISSCACQEKFSSLFIDPSGRPCFCTGKRKLAPGSKDLPGYQLQRAVALLQVKSNLYLKLRSWSWWNPSVQDLHPLFDALLWSHTRRHRV